MKVLITGVTGQLGHELAKQFEAEAIGLFRPEFDLNDDRTIVDSITRHLPDAVINCAAYTAVDQAESDAESCYRANAHAVETMAETCRIVDCPLVQVSTDYVFGADTFRSTPYRENDRPGPQGVYGASKYRGEQFAIDWHRHYIVRTCGLYTMDENGPIRGKNFVDTMRCLAEERDQLSIVADQFCTPTFVPQLATAIRFLLTTEQYGTYHVTNQGQTTWFDFAAEIFRLSGKEMELQRITTEEFGATAPRPRYSVLDSSKYHSLGGPGMTDWKTALQQYFESSWSRTGTVSA